MTLYNDLLGLPLIGESERTGLIHTALSLLPQVLQAHEKNNWPALSFLHDRDFTVALQETPFDRFTHI